MFGRFKRFGWPGALAALLMVNVGCATQREIKPDRPLSETRLFVTRSAEAVTLSWDSRPNMAYTIYYNSTRSARSPWKVLPGFDYIRGTGRTLVYTDRVPLNETRFYRLHAEPAVSLNR
ncbi:MAG TPA: hypothetical protein PKE26_02325 [Kiritimatiellia bacterium]|nr:hypothetical protein [Kiritimatiellia bacterium]HMO97924.1 hypothetical protein [Kiritimatiellia bacterium]HMP95275.1 hypothetical protein [Kiritimatiellia bacterium]